MRIINITKNYTFCIVTSIFAFCALVLSAGCAQKNDLEKPRSLVAQSQKYYQGAVGAYADLIKKGKDLDRLYLELGKLYYAHGDFEKAVSAFRNSGEIEAKKFLAVSYYRAANFTDALEVFNKQEIADGEYLYYKGLVCEKLNLFDKALEAYKKIKDGEFSSLALRRIEIIERSAEGNIKDISARAQNILAAAPAQEKYPQAGALILSCDEKIEVSPENTQVFYMHYLIKILNERGKESFAETHIDYDSTFEKVELEYARTIKPDGKVLEVGSRHIRDVSKYLNFPLYSNARVFIISFPEIAEGATIEYKLKIFRSQLVNKKDFVLNYPLQSREPIIDADFSVSLPKDSPLHIKVINEKYNDFGAAVMPAVKDAGNSVVYGWHFKDIPQIIPESNMPPAVQINPTLLLSTFSSWQDVYDWWWGLARDKIKSDEAIKNKVRELIKDKDSEEAKARAIYNFCAQKIRYVAVEYGQAGYEPHFAADIFKNKYGDCKDQAILLVTMLKEAAISSWPVLIGTKEYYNLNDDLPSMLFNHAIAAAFVNNKVVFLDPTVETCSFGDLPAGDQQRRVMVFKEDGYKIQDTPLFAAASNRVVQRLSLKVNSDESITAQKVNLTSGIYDQGQRYWLLYTPPELIEERLKEKIQDVSIGAKLDNYKIENLTELDEPIVLSYAFHGPEYFTEAGALRITPQLTGLDSSIVAKDKRRYPIDFGVLDVKETVFEISVPEGFAIKYIPAAIKKESPWLRFTAEYAVKDNTVSFIQNTELINNAVSDSEYADFKKFFEELAKLAKQRIVFEKIK